MHLAKHNKIISLERDLLILYIPSPPLDPQIPLATVIQICRDAFSDPGQLPRGRYLVRQVCDEAHQRLQAWTEQVLCPWPAYR